jgi:hypothetical protein
MALIHGSKMQQEDDRAEILNVLDELTEGR